MTYERFKEILEEYKYTQREIDELWATRPTDAIDEPRLRATAKANAGRAGA